MKVYMRNVDCVRYGLCFKRSMIVHGNSPTLVNNLYNKIRIFKRIEITEFSKNSKVKRN